MSDTAKSWIEERHNRQNGPHESIVSLDRAMTDAHNMFPRALSALEAVIELHQPVSRFTMYGYEDYSFLSVEDAHAFAGEPFEVDEFRLCAECMRVEDGAANNAEEVGYETSLYPCPTVQAIEGAINE